MSQLTTTKSTTSVQPTSNITNSTRQSISLLINEDHPAYQWAKKQSDSVNAFGHIGTHIDCYTKVPENSHYITDTLLLDCTQVMPCIDDIEKLDIVGKSLVLFTANLENNGYGTPEYGKTYTALDSDVLDAILAKNPAFIVIDSYGIGAHGDEHISFDKRCEENDCFVIENVVLNHEMAVTSQRLPVRLVGMAWLNAHTISLRLQSEQPYGFRAGQYLNLPLPSSQKSMPFSIASKPYQGERSQNDQLNTIEIQIGGVLPDSELASDIEQFRSQWLNQQPFYLGQAAGEAYFRETDSSVTVIAGGSGFSYAKSIVLQALSLPNAIDITLYWGAKNVADLYEHNAMVALAKQHPQFHYVPVVEGLAQAAEKH